MNVDLPTPVGAKITPISPLAKPPFNRLSIPGTPIGIGTTTYVENNAGSIISSIGSPNGTALYENGYSVAISTTVTGVSTVLSPVGPSSKIYNQVRGTNGVGISTFNVLISYSISTGQPLSTSIVLTDGGNNFIEVIAAVLLHNTA